MSTLDRMERLRGQMASKGLDAYICHDNSDLFWATGLDGIFDEEEAHFAVITADEAVLHTDSRYINAFATRAAQGLAPGWGFTTDPSRHSAFIAERLARIASASHTLRVGIEADLPLNLYRMVSRVLGDAGLSVELVETEGLVVGLRSIKDAEEIARLRASQKVTDAAFAHICEFIRPGLTELELACELDFEMRRLGAQALAFPSIVAAGENAASPHSQPGKRLTKTGDLVLFDFGAKVDGYCSDMTRCICLGEPDGTQREVYDVVLAAQTAAERAIRAGVTGAAMHGIAADVIGQAGYGDRFGHGLGHGVGIDIHEAPSLSPNNDRMLEVGSVVTVEPGIYLPDRLGIRIEDFGVVMEDGFEVFTESPHQLVIR